MSIDTAFGDTGTGLPDRTSDPAGWSDTVAFPDDPWAQVSDSFGGGFHDSPDDRAGSAADGAPGGEVPVPDWAVRLGEDALREDLAAATSAPVDRDALALLSLLNPEVLAARARRARSGRGPHAAPAVEAARMLLDGIVVAARVINHAQAVQQRLLAAFTRPGVAVSLEDLADLAGTGLADMIAAHDITTALDTHAGSTADTAGPAGTGTAGPTGPGTPGLDWAATHARDATAAGADGAGTLGGDTAAACGADPTRLGAPVVGAAALGVAASARAGVADVVDTMSSGAAASGATASDAGPSDRGVWAVAASSVVAEVAAKAASAEVACALHLAPVTARLRCETAREIVEHLPGTLAAQQAGDLDGFRARTILERVAVLPTELRGRVEQAVLPSATTLTLAGLKRLIDREVIAADPAAASRREEQARESRTVFVSPGENGSGMFGAVVSAMDAELAYRLLDTVAHSLTTAKLTAGRTTAQLRADAFVDLFRSLADTGHAHLPGHTCQSDAFLGSTRPEGTATCGTPRPAGGGRHDTDAGSLPGSAHKNPRRDSPTAGDHAGNRAERGNRPGGSPAVSGGGCATRGRDDARDTGPGPGAPTGEQPVWCGRPLTSGPAGATVTVRRPVALNVYLDAATLAGLDDKPGELDGHGAITAQTARALAASADTIRAIITRPADGNRACGTILDGGRAVYRPPDSTADYVTARDRTCTFPGCRTPARRCDLDHRHPHDSGGDTCPCNLDTLCRTHHRLKTLTPWQQHPDPATGLLAWTSPLGHTYPTEQAHLLRSEPDDLADDPPPF